MLVHTHIFMHTYFYIHMYILKFIMSEKAFDPYKHIQCLSATYAYFVAVCAFNFEDYIFNYCLNFYFLRMSVIFVFLKIRYFPLTIILNTLHLLLFSF